MNQSTQITQTAPQSPVGPVRLPSDARVRPGQATMVEQSRAQAQVQIQAMMARQFPRNAQAARLEMLESCRQERLAERAFYRFPRAGQTVQGPSVHLARELARCWGNIEHGIWELSRDDERGQSEMMAWAWDVQTNTRSANVFIVPHKRDKKIDGVSTPEALVDMRDIYENNANNGARRLREAIFSVLPPWFVEEAQRACRHTLENGGGKPLAQRIDDCLQHFKTLGVQKAQLEAKVTKQVAEWDVHDVAQFGVIFESIKRGEVTVDDEFESVQVTTDEIKARARNRKQPDTPAAPVDDPADGTPLRPDDPDLTAHEQQ